MLRFAESFDHYGGRSDALLGTWAQIDTNMSISTAQARTGTKSLRIGYGGGTQTARYSIPGSPLQVIGLGYAISLDTLPGSDRLKLFIRDVSNNTLMTLLVLTSGAISVYSGTSTLIDTTDNIITTGTFHHIELRVFFDSSVGEIELRVNGVVQLQLDNLNLGNTPASQVVWQGDGNTTDRYYLDDIFIWDEEGDFNNTFLGPLRVLTTYADADSTPQDWTVVGAADAFAAVNQTSPDGDTTYIGSDTATEKATLLMPELPPEVATVAGVYIPAMARIDAAGTGEFKYQ